MEALAEIDRGAVETLTENLKQAVARHLAQQPARRESLFEALSALANTTAIFLAACGPDEPELRNHLDLELMQALDIPPFLPRQQ